LAQQSGVCLTYSSKPRGGTTVRLYLPRAADAVQGQLPLAAALTESEASHVLLVEDDLLVRAQAGRLLSGLGYRVTVADDGPSALAALEGAADISLLMTDMVMPGGMNGRELAVRARRNRPSLRVLLTSGYTEAAAPLGAGPDIGSGFLPKPYRRAQLAEAVSAALSRSQPFPASRASTRQSLSERPAQ
jgi:CheY-like chemotaxis protein